MNQPLNDPSPASVILAERVEVPKTLPIDGRQKADVVVIGAGITGLSAALHLAQKGREVVVLEAGPISRGGSGRPLGLVLPHHHLDPDQLVARFGHRVGRRLVEGILEGPSLVEAIIKAHHIECELRNGGWIMAAHKPAAEHRIRASVASWSKDTNKDTNQVSLLTADEMKQATGSSFYSCGLIDKRAFGLNPYAYTVGLARTALSHGVRIYTESRVISLEGSDKRWRATTATGQAEAAEIVVATDAYTDNLVPAIRRAVLPVRLYQLVSEPLASDVAAEILPGQPILTDTRRLYGGVRKTADDRLQISVDGPPTAFSGRAFRDAATRRITSLYPHLGQLKWADEWSGWVGMTRSHLPHIWRVEDGLTAAVGMNGRGIAMATLLGRDLSWRLTGAKEEECFVPIDPPLSWHAPGVLWPAVEVVVRWKRLLDYLDLRQRSRN